MDAKGLCLGLLLDGKEKEQEQVANLQQQLVALWQGKAFRSKSKAVLGEYIAGFLGHVAYECLCFVVFFARFVCVFLANFCSGPAQVATHHREHPD